MNTQIEKIIRKLLKEKVSTIEVETEENYYFRESNAIPNDSDFIQFLNHIDKGNYMMIEFNISEKFVTIIKKNAMNITQYHIKVYEDGCAITQFIEHKFLEIEDVFLVDDYSEFAEKIATNELYKRFMKMYHHFK